MAFTVGTKTDVGKRRSKNEDAFYADRRNGIFIVADGLGGHRAGDVASRLAVEGIVGFMKKQKNALTYKELLKEAVEKANKQIYDRSLGDPRLRGMGTTVVLALIRKGMLYLAHVGDSRAYLFSDKGLRQLTEDHTITFELFKQGKLNKNSIPQHPYHGLLLRSVGLEEGVEVAVQESTYGGDRLLLCTDGLTDMVGDKEVEEILRINPEPQKACDELVKAALDHGGLDNITAVVVKETGKDA